MGPGEEASTKTHSIQRLQELPREENFIKFVFCFRILGWQNKSWIELGRLEAGNLTLSLSRKEK